MSAGSIIRSLCFILIGTAVAALPGWASEEGQRPVLKGAYIEFPPLTYTNDQGEPAGPYIRESTRLAREAGYDVEWRSLPIDRIYLYLQKGKLDLWIGSQGVPAIDGWTLEPDFSFPPIRLNAYHLEKTPSVSGRADLRGKHLILIRGYTYRDYLDPVTNAEATRVDTASSHRAALRMLQAERGDYLLNFEAPINNALEESSITDLRHSPITEWETTLVFSAQTDRAKKLVQDFEKAQASTDTRFRR